MYTTLDADKVSYDIYCILLIILVLRIFFWMIDLMIQLCLTREILLKQHKKNQTSLTFSGGGSFNKNQQRKTK